MANGVAVVGVDKYGSSESPFFEAAD